MHQYETLLTALILVQEYIPLDTWGSACPLNLYLAPSHDGPGHDHSSNTRMAAAFHSQFHRSCSELACAESQVCSVPLDTVVGQHLTHLLASPGDVWSETQEFNGFHFFPFVILFNITNTETMLYNSHNSITDPCENVPYPPLGFYKQGIIPVIIEQLSAWLRQAMRSVLLNANLLNVESIKAPFEGHANKQELVLVVRYCRLDSILTKHCNLNRCYEIWK